MRHICYCFTILLLAFSLPCSARLHRLSRALVASPPDPILTPPSHDPFYQVPTDFSSYEPGQIVRSRPISTSAFKTIYARSATQYFYRTTGNGNEVDGTVVTVVSPVVPRATRRNGALRHSILVVGTAEDSAALDCAPSYVYSSVDKSSNSALVNIFNRPVISAALFRGWYVVVPDGEGSKSAFLSRLVQGRSLLDGVRASQSRLPFLRDANVAIVGYSGGANAAAAAAELWHNYAPEINVVGVSIGGIPADLNATTYRLDGGRFAGLAFAGAAGLGNVHADFDAFLDANLSEEGKRNFTRLRDGEWCELQAASNLSGLHLQSAFRSDYSGGGGGEDILKAPITQQIFAREKLGQDVVRIPMSLFHSKTDQIVPYQQAADYVQDQCDRGANVHLAWLSGLGHLSAGLRTLPPLFHMARLYLEDDFGTKQVAALDHCGVEPIGTGLLETHRVQTMELMGPEAVRLMGESDEARQARGGGD